MVNELTAVLTATTSATVSWKHDQSGPPTHYIIERRIGGGSYSYLGRQPYIAGRGDYRVVDNTATSGAQYRVAAANDFGQSDWVESNVLSLQPGNVPNPVTDLVASV